MIIVMIGKEIDKYLYKHFRVALSHPNTQTNFNP